MVFKLVVDFQYSWFDVFCSSIRCSVICVNNDRVLLLITMSNRSSESSTYDIRLCHIIKWNDFDGYGFNLHAEKGKPGQYIGKVDEGSPAEAAGLKEGDRIVEVNGVNISNENHKQVVQRIKTTANEAKLLVVDPEADNYFRSNNIVVKSSLPNVRILKTPSKKQTNILLTNGDEGDDAHSQISGKSMENEVIILLIS